MLIEFKWETCLLLIPRRASLALAPLPVIPVGADVLIGPLSVLVSGRSGDRPLRTSLRGESKEGPQPLFVSFQIGWFSGGRDALSKRAGGTFVAKAGSKLVCDLGKRNRNLPLPCGVSFATFLCPNKEKLHTQPALIHRPVQTNKAKTALPHSFEAGRLFYSSGSNLLIV